MAHPNVETLRRIDEAMLKEDMDTFFAQYTDDVVVHVAGTSKLAGDYKGLDQLQELFGRFMEAAGEFSFENHAYLADDEHGLILQRSTMRRGDKSFSTNEASRWPQALTASCSRAPLTPGIGSSPAP